MRPRARKFLKRSEHVERRGVAVRILALREQARFLALRAAGHEGDEFEKRVGRRREREIALQCLSKRLAAHGCQMRRAEHADDLIDEPQIILDEDAETVADLIVETALGKVELNVPGLLFGAFAVQPPAREKSRARGIVAATANRRRRRGLDDSRRRGSGRLARRLCQFLRERLQHARGVLAARRAEIEPRLLAVGQRVGVGRAVVAALAAVLLRHRRHHPPPQRPPLRQPHALVERDGLVVPGRLAVIDLAQHGGVLLRRERRHRAAFRRREAREEAAEPGALFRAERRALWNEAGRGRDVSHDEASASARRRIVSMS